MSNEQVTERSSVTDDLPPTTDHRPLTAYLTGWLLDEACAVLQSDERMKVLPLSIVSTAPPWKEFQSAHPSIEFGAWRVLRCRIIESMDAASAGAASVIEILVAREQIVGTR
jgi:hypothetical protein